MNQDTYYGRGYCPRCLKGTDECTCIQDDIKRYVDQIPQPKEDKTPMQKLFSEFEALSESSEFAGDKQTSGLINFLCERKHIALSEESKYIRDRERKAAEKGWDAAEKFNENKTGYSAFSIDDLYPDKKEYINTNYPKQ